MTARQLIALLKQLPPDSEIHLWDLGYGDHLPVDKIDTVEHDRVYVLEPAEPEEEEKG